jgi:hypothetical protein
MAAIAVTASAVIPSRDAVIRTGLANAAIAIGKTVYYNESTKRYGLYDVNGATEEIRNLVGICVAASSAAEQAISVQVDGRLTMNAVLVKARFYIGGATPGDIVPVADITTGWYPALLGFAESTTVLRLTVKNYGIVA